MVLLVLQVALVVGECVVGVGRSVCVGVGVVTCGYAGSGCGRGCRWGVGVVKSGGCMCVCECM